MIVAGFDKWNNHNPAHYIKYCANSPAKWNVAIKRKKRTFQKVRFFGDAIDSSRQSFRLLPLHLENYLRQSFRGLIATDPDSGGFDIF